jgi:hypothetical protein
MPLIAAEICQIVGFDEAARFVSLLDPANALRKVGSAGKPPLFVDMALAPIRR